MNGNEKCSKIKFIADCREKKKEVNQKMDNEYTVQVRKNDDGTWASPYRI